MERGYFHSTPSPGLATEGSGLWVGQEGVCWVGVGRTGAIAQRWHHGVHRMWVSWGVGGEHGIHPVVQPQQPPWLAAERLGEGGAQGEVVSIFLPLTNPCPAPCCGAGAPGALPTDQDCPTVTCSCCSSLSPLSAVLEALTPGCSALTLHLSSLGCDSLADGVTRMGRSSEERSDSPWGCLKPLCCVFHPRAGHFAAPQAHPTVGARAGCLHRDTLFQLDAKYVPMFVCALKLGSAGELCAGRCPKLLEQAELASVIAPCAKNSLPDKDAFLGATGRILRVFRLAGPQRNPVPLSRWGVGWQLGKELARI